MNSTFPEVTVEVLPEPLVFELDSDNPIPRPTPKVTNQGCQIKPEPAMVVPIVVVSDSA